MPFLRAALLKKNLTPVSEQPEILLPPLIAEQPEPEEDFSPTKIEELHKLIDIRTQEAEKVEPETSPPLPPEPAAEPEPLPEQEQELETPQEFEPPLAEPAEEIEFIPEFLQEPETESEPVIFIVEEELPEIEFLPEPVPVIEIEPEFVREAEPETVIEAETASDLTEESQPEVINEVPPEPETETPQETEIIEEADEPVQEDLTPAETQETISEDIASEAEEPLTEEVPPETEEPLPEITSDEDAEPLTEDTGESETAIPETESSKSELFDENSLLDETPEPLPEPEIPSEPEVTVSEPETSTDEMTVQESDTEAEDEAGNESEPEDFALKYDFTSGERYVDKVSTKTEFDKMLDELAGISKELITWQTEKFARDYTSRFQEETQAEARKYEAFLGGYITNAAMILYDKGYRDAALKQLEQAKSILEARKKLEDETSAIKSRVEEQNDAVDLSDILGLFGDG
ncbi:MAG: hypothetical protein IJ697_09170 [Synergistaceae bacterium]|nr:hypothetical protein [Synergistaceae bacterium]